MMASRAASEMSMSDQASTPQLLYLDLMKKCLTRSAFGETFRPLRPRQGGVWHTLYAPVRRLLAARRLELVRRVSFDVARAAHGLDWPAEAETMIGLCRLDNLQYCAGRVLREEVPGDLVEAGVWRGGAAIFMRAVLKAHGDTGRIVWAADSFQGLPKPDPGRYAADAGDSLWTFSNMAVPLDEVRGNFARYGLLDDQVRFVAGWFSDTLPAAPIERLAVLRVDADMYGSTMDVLRYLYPKLSVGGYVIIDDYGAMQSCKAAVEDFRQANGIAEPLEPIDWSGVFWRRVR